MIIKIESSREFYPAILEEFKNNPLAISDMSKYVAKNAESIAKEAFESAVGPSEKYLKESNITLKVAVEFGNTNDFTSDLSERMTSEEKNKVKKLYSDLREALSLCHEECIYEALEGLEELIGKDFFKNE